LAWWPVLSRPGLGISARTSVDYSQTAHVIKAGKPVAVTSSDTTMVR
jgi:hypothetical protein